MRAKEDRLVLATLAASAIYRRLIVLFLSMVARVGKKLAI
jgi:hypothetical protein